MSFLDRIPKNFCLLCGVSQLDILVCKIILVYLGFKLNLDTGEAV